MSHTFYDDERYSLDQTSGPLRLVWLFDHQPRNDDTPGGSEDDACVVMRPDKAMAIARAILGFLDPVACRIVRACDQLRVDTGARPNKLSIRPDLWAQFMEEERDAGLYHGPAFDPANPHNGGAKTRVLFGAYELEVDFRAGIETFEVA